MMHFVGEVRPTGNVKWGGGASDIGGYKAMGLSMSVSSAGANGQRGPALSEKTLAVEKQTSSRVRRS